MFERTRRKKVQLVGGKKLISVNKKLLELWRLFAVKTEDIHAVEEIFHDKSKRNENLRISDSSEI